VPITADDLYLAASLQR